MQLEQAKQEYEFYCEAFRLCGSFANRAYSRHDGSKQSFWEKQEELVLALFAAILIQRWLRPKPCTLGFPCDGEPDSRR